MENNSGKIFSTNIFRKVLGKCVSLRWQQIEVGHGHHGHVVFLDDGPGLAVAEPQLLEFVLPVHAVHCVEGLRLVLLSVHHTLLQHKNNQISLKGLKSAY